MTLTLKCIADSAREGWPVYFVVQRGDGHWSPAAKILHVMEAEWSAEDMVAKLKQQHPHQNYGVAVLRSEARLVSNPIEIVRMENN